MGSTWRKARGTESGRPLTSRIASASVSCTTRYHAPRRSGQVVRARNRAHCCTWFMHALQSVRGRLQLLGRPPPVPPPVSTWRYIIVWRTPEHRDARHHGGAHVRGGKSSGLLNVFVLPINPDQRRAHPTRRGTPRCSADSAMSAASRATAPGADRSDTHRSDRPSSPAAAGLWGDDAQRSTGAAVCRPRNRGASLVPERAYGRRRARPRRVCAQ